MIGEIAETNLKQNATETVNDWFTMNPIIEGKETKAVNPKGLDMNPNKEDKNNYYLTDSNTGRVYFINLSSNKVYEQTAKGDIETGESLFEILKAIYTDKIIIIISHSPKYLNHCNKIIEIKDKELIQFG